MIDPNMARELDKLAKALHVADEFFTHRDQMNARVHADTPRWSPITLQIKSAQRSLTFIRHELEAEPVFIPPFSPRAPDSIAGDYIDPNSGGDV